MELYILCGHEEYHDILSCYGGGGGGRRDFVCIKYLVIVIKNNYINSCRVRRSMGFECLVIRGAVLGDLQRQLFS